MQLIVHFMLKLWIPRVNAVAKAEQKKIELLCDIIPRKDQNSKPKDSFFISVHHFYTVVKSESCE